MNKQIYSFLSIIYKHINNSLKVPLQNRLNQIKVDSLCHSSYEKKSYDHNTILTTPGFPVKLRIECKYQYQNPFL
jgi:hypothetical protein